MENSTPCKYKWLKILRKRPDYIITSQSRGVPQNLTEIGSPIVGWANRGSFSFFYYIIVMTANSYSANCAFDLTQLTYFFINIIQLRSQYFTFYKLKCLQ